MRRDDFKKDIQRLLENAPTKSFVKTGHFGPFTFRKPYTISLPKSIINDYNSFILNNFKPFEEDIVEPPAKESVLYSLSKPDEPIQGLFQSAPEENILFETSSHADKPPKSRFSIEEFGDMLPEEIRRTLIKESFSDMLIRFQNEKRMTGPQLYKAAGIDYRHYSKIISDRDYKPKKETAFALAIALELNLSEAEEFIGRAGYTFSPSNLFDMTVKYFIQNRIYNRDTIDLLMDSMKLSLLPQNWDVRHI